MTRFQENREKILRVSQIFVPRFRRGCTRKNWQPIGGLAYWAGQTQFEVKNGLQSFTIDLATTHCS